MLLLLLLFRRHFVVSYSPAPILIDTETRYFSKGWGSEIPYISLLPTSSLLEPLPTNSSSSSSTTLLHKEEASVTSS